MKFILNVYTLVAVGLAVLTVTTFPAGAPATGQTVWLATATIIMWIGIAAREKK